MDKAKSVQRGPPALLLVKGAPGINAKVTLDLVDGAPTCTSSEITVTGVVPGIDQAAFAQTPREQRPAKAARSLVPSLGSTSRLAPLCHNRTCGR